MDDNSSADEWEEWIGNNKDKAVMILGEGFQIHNFQWSENEIQFFVGNTLGYNYEATWNALRQFAQNDTPYKIVDKNNVLDEAGALAEGDYDSVEEWADNMEEENENEG